MAVKVTGMFRHPISRQLFDSPVLVLYPTLHYKNFINMQVDIVEQTSGKLFLNNIDKNELIYDETISNHYDGLIDALEQYVIDSLTLCCSDCQFEKGFTFDEPEINTNDEFEGFETPNNE